MTDEPRGAGRAGPAPQVLRVWGTGISRRGQVAGAQTPVRRECAPVLRARLWLLLL